MVGFSDCTGSWKLIAVIDIAIMNLLRYKLTASFWTYTIQNYCKLLLYKLVDIQYVHDKMFNYLKFRTSSKVHLHVWDISP